jgi:protein phosphatase PTC7
MAATRIIQPHIRSPLSRKHCVSIFRPPNLQKHRVSIQFATSQEHGISSRPLSSPGIRTFSSSATKFSSNPKFSYNISASYSDKKKPLDPSRNVYTHDNIGKTKHHTSLPLKERKLARPKSGQDSFFISQVDGTQDTALAVVDGVGGWEASGVDPADFAHSLCEYMSCAASTYPSQFGSNSTKPLHPQDLLELGTQKVMADITVHAGGSTACVATISSSGVLDVAKYAPIPNY